jgi:hypothetical protein
MFSRQEEDNSTAQQILSDLRADPAARVPDFCLYLRAFESTGKLHVPLYLRVRRKCVWVAQRLVTDDLESHVSLSAGRRAPLVALGKPGEAIGAGRIFTDDATWQADIATLMRRAKGILIVPSDRDGTCFFQPNFTNSPTTCNISHRFASPVAHEAHTFRPEAS